MRCPVSADGRHRDRRGHTLFIDARKLGRMETRVHRVLDESDIERVAGTYHAWRSDGGEYEDVAGFCYSATTEEIAGHDFVLTPGRYVGVEDAEDDGEVFEEKMERLVGTLGEQFAEGDPRLPPSANSSGSPGGYELVRLDMPPRLW